MKKNEINAMVQFKGDRKGVRLYNIINKAIFPQITFSKRGGDIFRLYFSGH